MDRRVTPPKRNTSPNWGTPPPCRQALTLCPGIWHLDFLWSALLSSHSSISFSLKNLRKFCFQFSNGPLLASRETANTTYAIFFVLSENILHRGNVKVPNRILNRQQLGTTKARACVLYTRQPLSQGFLLPALRRRRSALVNIRRKALGHLMKFTQGRLK